MVDTREAILSRLFAVIGTVAAVAAVGRNVEDVPGLARPAIILRDGAEDFFDKPETERRSRVQRMQMTPGLMILAGADSSSVGFLLNTLRARLIVAVVGDAELWGLVSQRNGEIRYGGCERLPASPESKEGRMEVSFALTYVLRLSDLSS